MRTVPRGNNRTAKSKKAKINTVFQNDIRLHGGFQTTEATSPRGLKS
jgi:hypothetical protein